MLSMALALLLTSTPMVSEAEEPGEGVQASTEKEAGAEMDAFAEESEALEAEAERQMPEKAHVGESEPEVGSANA